MRTFLKLVMGVLIFSMSSCGSSKKSLKYKTAEDSVKETKQVSVINEQSKISESDKSNEIVVTETILYDTRINDNKGNNPILSITKTKIIKGIEKIKNSEIVKNENTDITKKERIEVFKEIKDTKEITPVNWKLIIWGIILITMLIMWIIFKKVSIFKKI